MQFNCSEEFVNHCLKRLMHCGDFSGHIHVKLFHPSCQKTGLGPPVFDCLPGHFHKAFLSDSGELPYYLLSRQNKWSLSYRIFLHHTKAAKPILNEILETI